MTVEHLECGRPGAARARDAAATRAVVGSVLQDIETRGDIAVRPSSGKLDDHGPPAFEPSDGSIRAIRP